jgi:hypothetical protein
MLKAGFPEMGVQIEKSRNEHLSLALDRLFRPVGLEILADLSDLSRRDFQIADLIDAARGIENPDVLD